MTERIDLARKVVKARLKANKQDPTLADTISDEVLLNILDIHEAEAPIKAHDKGK